MKGRALHHLTSPGIRFAIFLAAITVFLLALLGLVGPLRERLQLQASLDNTQRRRQQQEILFPFYQSLLSRDRLGHWQDLKAGDPEPLGQEQIVQVPSMLVDLVTLHGYRVGERADYRVHKQNDNERVLQVSLPLQGDYANFGGVLGDLLRQPYLKDITFLNVNTVNGTPMIVIGMNLLLEP